MRITLIFLVIVLLMSCSEKQIESKSIKLKFFLDEFVKQNPNWNQNEIINSQINEKFEKEITYQITNGILNDFPLELSEINEFKKDSFAAAFNSHYSKNESIKPENIIYNTKFDVIGLITKEKIQVLKTDKTYLIKGKFKEFLKKDYNKYTNGLVYSPLIGLSSTFSKLDVNMGVILMEISEVKEVPKL